MDGWPSRILIRVAHTDRHQTLKRPWDCAPDIADIAHIIEASDRFEYIIPTGGF